MELLTNIKYKILSLLNLVILLLLTDSVYSAPSPINYRFRKPVAVSAGVWKFLSITGGVDAIVTIVGSQNATINMIDDSSTYAYSWQPRLQYTNTMSNSSDSSYIEFKIEFVSNSTGLHVIQDSIAMTLIDVDGNNNYREMIKSSLPASSKGITGSALSVSQDSRWLTTIGASTDFPTIDTSIYQAMTQINISNASSYFIRIGVVGTITSNTIRQHSLYFKPFKAMTFPLSVKLLNFKASMNSSYNQLNWSTTFEKNLDKFEIYRSTDGEDYFPIGNIDATNLDDQQVNYTFTDFDKLSLNKQNTYYRLKIIDMDGNSTFSNITTIRFNESNQDHSVSVFPNPSTEFINIAINSGVFESITLLDASGRNVMNVNSSDLDYTNDIIQLDVRNLENGSYFINILDIDGNNKTVQFIKR